MNRSVLIFSLIPGYGGGEKYICDLVTHLDSSYEWYLSVCSREVADKLSVLVVPKNIKVLYNNGRNSRISSAVSTVEFAVINRVEVVILNGISEIRYSLLFRLGGITTVGIIHTLQVDTLAGPGRSQYLFSLRNCNSIVSVSKQATYHYPIDIRKKIDIIYNYTPRPALIYGRVTANYDIRKVLYVGRVEQSKGIEDIYALAGIFEDVQFDVLGAPGTGDSDLALMPHKPINVHLRGFCINVYDYYSACDLFLFPSRSEGGLPLALLEAASVGLPIIASRIPAHMELGEHIDGMLLYDPGDLDQLVKCFQALVKPAARQDAGLRIYTSYLEFSKNNDFAGRYRRILDRL